MSSKLNVGAILSEVFSTYRDQAVVLLPVAFWLFLVVAIVSGVTRRNPALLAIDFAVSLIAVTLYQETVVGAGVRRQGRPARLLGRRVDEVGGPGDTALIGVGPSVGPGRRPRLCLAVRSRHHPVDGLGRHRVGDRHRARRCLRRVRPLARARSRKGVAGLRRDHRGIRDHIRRRACVHRRCNCHRQQLPRLDRLGRHALGLAALIPTRSQHGASIFSGRHRR